MAKKKLNIKTKLPKAGMGFAGNLQTTRENNLNMAKSKIKMKMGGKLKKAETGYGDPTFYPGDEGWDEQQAQNNLSLNPVTGQYNPQFNPALTYGLQEKYGNKAAPYLNTYEGSQYADYINQQPQTQNNQQTNNQFRPINSTPGIVQNLQKIGSGAQKMAKGDWKGGIQDFAGTEFELAKGISNIFVANKVNPRLEKQVANNYKDALTQPFLNDYNDNQYGTTNIPMSKYGMKMMEHGGMEEITHGHQLEAPREESTVEVEKVGGKPEILISKDKVLAVGKKSHKAGGTTIDTSKLGGEIGILSSTLIDPQTGLPYSQDSKKLVTSKDEKWKEDNFSKLDPINLATTDMVISKKVSDAQAKFQQQEQDIMSGMHGIEPIKSRMENMPTAKYGGKAGKFKMPQAENGFNYNFQEDKRKLDPLYSKMRQQKTPTGVVYEPPIVDVAGWKSIENQLNLAHPNGIPFSDNLQGYYGNIKDQQQLTNLGYQEQYYDDMLETPEGRQELAKMWQSKGKTLKGKDLKTDTDNLTSLSDKDLYDRLNSLRPAYLDSYPKVRKGEKYINPNPTPPLVKKLENKTVRPESTPSIVNKLDKFGKNTNQGNNIIPIVNPFQEPYLESPVTRFKFNPNLIDYRKQNPDFTEIDRQYQGALTGNNRIDANLFSKGLNAKNQLQSQAFNQNQQGQLQVDQYNAGALDRNQQLQYGENAQYRGLVDQMRGNLNTQKLMDLKQAQGNFQKQFDYYNSLPELERLYGVNPNDPLYTPDFYQTMGLTKPKQTKKFGGKVSIKPKLKKKSSK